MTTGGRRKVENILLLLAITHACFLIQTVKCEDRKPPPPDYYVFPVCGTNQVGPPNYFEHTDLSFNYRLYFSPNDIFFAIFSEGYGCDIKFTLDITGNLPDKESPYYQNACYMKPLEGSNFCCVSNSEEHPNYGTKCFESFNRTYLLQIPDSRDNDGFLGYIYVDDLFFEATTYDKFYENFYDYFYDHLYYTNDRLKGSNYLGHTSQFEVTTFTSTASTSASTLNGNGDQSSQQVYVDPPNGHNNNNNNQNSNNSGSSQLLFSFVLFLVSLFC